MDYMLLSLHNDSTLQGPLHKQHGSRHLLTETSSQQARTARKLLWQTVLCRNCQSSQGCCAMSHLARIQQNNFGESQPCAHKHAYIMRLLAGTCINGVYKSKNPGKLPTATARHPQQGSAVTVPRTAMPQLHNSLAIVTKKQSRYTNPQHCHMVPA